VHRDLFSKNENLRMNASDESDHKKKEQEKRKGKEDTNMLAKSIIKNGLHTTSSRSYFYSQRIITTGAHRRLSSSSSSSSSSIEFAATPDVCDDVGDERIRVIDPTLGLKNLGGRKKFGGQVVTVKCYEDNSMIKHLAKNVNGTGKVIVVDGGGSKRRALLGDMVATDCINNGWEGLVIYGCIRDVDEISNMKDLGVHALGTHPQKTIKRNEGQINIPITFGGITINNDDWIVCDNNGIVVNEIDPRQEREKQRKTDEEN
jgi:regulator of ribonuclease activity A